MAIILFIIGIILISIMLRQLSYQKSFLFKSNKILSRQKSALLIGVLGFILIIIGITRMH